MNFWMRHLLVYGLLVLLPAQHTAATVMQETPALLGDDQGAIVQDQAMKEVTNSLGALLQPFIENQGQFDDQVAYAIRHGSGSIFLSKQGELVFSLARSKQTENGPGSPTANVDPAAQSRPEQIDMFAFRIIPEAFGAPVSYRGQVKADTVVNYFIGPREKWRGAVPTWKEVRYAGIFPGISVVYRAGAGLVEDIYELEPGADPTSIRFRVEGAERLELREDGSLEVVTLAGPFIIQPPAAFQDIDGERRPIPCRFVTKGMTYGFSTGKYDSRLALQIDPRLVYGSFLGGAGSGSGISQGFSVAVANGKAYLAGVTDTSLFPATTGAYTTSFGGGQEIFLSVINPQGSGGADLVYSTFLGGSSGECLGGCNNLNGRRGIALDATGRVWMTGYTGSLDFPTTTGAFQETHSGGDNREGFFVIIDPQGNGPADLVYSSYLGGTNYDEGFGIAVADSKAWIIGTTASDDFPTTTGAYDTTNNTRGDVFLTVLNPQGAGSSDLVYSTYLGGILNESGYDIAVAYDTTAASYFAWLTGYVASSDFPVTPGAFDTSYNTNLDAFLSVISPKGTGAFDLVYSTYLGSTSYDQGYSIAVADNKAWLAGYTASAGFPVTGGAYDTSHNGLDDAFLAIVDPQGNGSTDLVYGTFIGGTNRDYGFSLAAAGGKAWMTGRTWSSDLPTTAGAYSTTYNGGSWDSFLVIIDPLGGGASDLSYATFLGGSTQEDGYGIAVAGGKAWLTGFTNSNDFPASTGAYDTSYNSGTWDAFLTIINPAGSGTTDLAYSSYLGAHGGGDRGYDIALADGKAWLAGTSSSPDFPITAGAVSSTPNDMYFAVIDPKAGENGLVYSTFFGGSGTDQVEEIVVADGKAWLTGMTTSPDFPVSVGAYDTSSNAGSYDAFLTVIDPKGKGSSDISYSTYLGSDGFEYGTDLAVVQGKAWLSGYTDSAAFPTTAGAFDTSLNGSYDPFMAIIRPGGNGTGDLVYSTYLGGSNYDRAISIAVDSGKAWLTGETTSADFPVTAGGYDTSYNSSDIFLSIINPLGQGAGDLFYSTYIGGSSGDSVEAIEVDEGMAWLAGYTTSADFPVTSGAYAATRNALEDLFLTIINPTKAGAAGLYYSTYLGGSDEDYLYDLAVTGGKAWLTGEVYSTDFPTTSNAFSSSYRGGGSDAYLAVITPDGAGNRDLFYSTYLGGLDYDVANGIAVKDGTAWLTGATSSKDFPFTADAYDTSMTPPDTFVMGFEVYRNFPWPMFLPAITNNAKP